MVMEERRDDVPDKNQADERGDCQQNDQSIRSDYDNRCYIMFTSSCSFNCFYNYVISSRAAKEHLNVEAELKFIAGIKEITVEVFLPPVQEMSNTALTVSDGTSEIKSKLKTVLDFLRDDVQGLGLRGMGSVGKTALLDLINNSLADDLLWFSSCDFSGCFRRLYY